MQWNLEEKIWNQMKIDELEDVTDEWTVKNSVEYQLWWNPYIFLLISVDFKSSLSFVKNYLGEHSLTRSAIDLSGGIQLPDV